MDEHSASSFSSTDNFFVTCRKVSLSDGTEVERIVAVASGPRGGKRLGEKAKALWDDKIRVKEDRKAMALPRLDSERDAFMLVTGSFIVVCSSVFTSLLE